MYQTYVEQLNLQLEKRQTLSGVNLDSDLVGVRNFNIDQAIHCKIGAAIIEQVIKIISLQKISDGTHNKLLLYIGCHVNILPGQIVVQHSVIMSNSLC